MFHFFEAWMQFYHEDGMIYLSKTQCSQVSVDNPPKFQVEVLFKNL